MESSQRAIFAGDLLAAYTELEKRAAAAYIDVPPRHRAEALRRRSLLLAFEGLEGWGVSLSRWLLQAASTGFSGDGQPTSALLRKCRAGLSPDVESLVASARRSGSVRRADMHRAISQCCAHQQFWERLAEGGGVVNEFTRYMWRPLHFAAAVGAPATVSALLALGADPNVHNGVGLTPLHVAVAHGAASAAAALAAHTPALCKATDKYGRTPADYALAATFDVDDCCAMLRAIRDAGRCRARCEGAVRARESYGGPSVRRRSGCVVVDELDAQSLVFDHLAIGIPVLITRSPLPANLATGWKRRAFVGTYGDVELPLERYPYAEGSAGLYNDTFNRSSVAALAASAEVGAPRSRTVRQVASSEDRRHVAAHPAGDPPRSVFIAMKGWAKDSSTDALSPADGASPFAADAPSSSRRLLADWRRPPCVADGGRLLRSHSIQFYLGGKGAGAQPHWHSTAWNWLAHGAKRWLLWPPQRAMYSQRHVSAALAGATASEGADFAADAAASGGADLSAYANATSALECKQRSGDVLVVPETWGHATVNTRQWSIGWATELQFDRTFDLGQAKAHGDEWWRDPASEPPSEAGGDIESTGEGGSSAAGGSAGGSPARPRRRRATRRTAATAGSSGRKTEL